MSTLRIGTAGWNVPPRYAEQLPGSGRHLERYARIFNAAEINSTFHRPHRRSTYERWAGAVGDDFRFSVKLPKQITHVRRLRECESCLDDFLAEIASLEPKRGPLLVQLAPSAVFESETAWAFFQALRARFGGDVACEPRHASWFSDEANHLLTESRIGRVAADPTSLDKARRPGGWDGLIYFRLHGSPRIYYSDYSAEYLASLAKKLETAIADSADVWCIFDNTASGAALGNALTILKAVRNK